MKTKFMQFIASLWEGWGEMKQVVENQPETTPLAANPAAELVKSSPVSLTDRVNRFLQSAYDFRYNLLTEETEFRPAGKVGEGFSSVGKRELNTFCLEAHARGIACWDKDISRYLYSTCVPAYHPFLLYMDELPAWDGVDRLEALARRVSSNPDEVELTSKGNVTRKMSEMGLLNLDEFDKYPASKMPLLKNLMQMANLNLCKAYQRNYRNLPRIASFIGTSNRFDLLSDPTGSRRFLCVEVKGKIDCSHIEHKQIYAQLKHELLEGVRYWFTAEEESELKEYNKKFQRRSMMEEILYACFRPAMTEDKDEMVQRLSAADIFKVLKKQNPAAMRGVNPNAFAQQLAPLGFPRSRSRYGNYYSVVALPENTLPPANLDK